MPTKSILILGGYGNTGLAIARLLLKWTDAKLALAGRSQSRAVETAAELNAEYEDIRVSGIKVDAASEKELKRALVGVDLLVVASSTAKYAHEVALATLASGVDYLDIQYSTAKLRTLQALADEIEQEGRCFITDGGFHPGLPAALVRYAADNIGQLERAVVGCALKVDWEGYSVGDETAEEFVSEMLEYQSLMCRDGQWRKASMWRLKDFLRLDYGEPFGRLYAMPMMLEEMRALPEMIPSLKETSFCITGFNWFVDWVVFPIGMLAMKLGPESIRRPVGRLTFRSMDKFSKPPYGIVLQLEASGQHAGQPKELMLRITHEDGYFLTAAPTVACIRQYLDGSALKPGLHFMAHIMDPARMLKDIEQMGVGVAMQQ